MARLSLPSLSHLPSEAAHSGIREIGNEALRTPGAIRLDVGQPNFPTPNHIGDAGKRAIDEHKTYYTHTQGILSLREKIVAKLERVNGIKVTPDRIACAPGGVGAIAAVFGAVLEPGDEVMLPDPGWPNTRLMLTWTAARGVFYPCSAADGFQPDIEVMERLITPRTKLLLINSPNNPTGAVYPRATIERLIELAQRHNLWLLSDECYDQIILDGSWTSPASLAPDDPRIVSIFTFSKSYSMTGWRIGYAAGSDELIDTATKVLESNSSCVSTITQVAAEAALDGPQDCDGGRARERSCRPTGSGGIGSAQGAQRPSTGRAPRSQLFGAPSAIQERIVKVSAVVRQPPAGGKPGQPCGITAPPRGRPWPRIRWASWLPLMLPGFTRSSLPVVAGALTLSAQATPASRLCLPLACCVGPV